MFIYNKFNKLKLIIAQIINNIYYILIYENK